MVMEKENNQAKFSALKEFDLPIDQYGIKEKNGVRKVEFPGGMVEAFHQGSFYLELLDDKAQTYSYRIINAEMIDDLPFETLETTLYYKKRDRRKKDITDIQLIETFQRGDELS